MLLQRILSPFVDVRKDEALTALLMFVYSFLAMTAYNIIQPLTRSKVIQSLGRGQRALGHPRLGPDHRRADGRATRELVARAAAALGAADHAGR